MPAARVSLYILNISGFGGSSFRLSITESPQSMHLLGRIQVELFSCERIDSIFDRTYTLLSGPGEGYAACIFPVEGPHPCAPKNERIQASASHPKVHQRNADSPKRVSCAFLNNASGNSDLVGSVVHLVRASRDSIVGETPSKKPCYL